MTERRKIGVMGGTFDPIHTGHLVTAEAVRMEYGLNKVLFIPASHPPHKQEFKITPAMHRYVMAVMATCSNPYFDVSSIEMERSGPSYTVDTARELLQRFGDSTDLYFITGADAIQDLESWEQIDTLLGLCHFIAATRPGCFSTLESVIEHFGELGRSHIHRLATPEFEISSTDIRNRVKQGRSIKYIVPESVEKYIYKEGLYR
jgi:nicotinate-nucleotide adenylyltransferase